MIAEIICVGTELLLGDILNTNAQYLSKRLADLGISVYFQSVVGDNEQRLLQTIKIAQERSDILIFSGGLGPTTDDITKETVAKALGLNLYLNEEEKERITQYFAKRNLNFTSNNMKQAMVPEGATVLVNNNGTAPGIYIKQNEKMYFILPGPPNELIPMFDGDVSPIIEKVTDGKIVSKTLKLVGIGESEAAQRIADIINNQTNPSVAPYAKLSEVHLRITAKANSKEEAMPMIEEMEASIRQHLGEYVYTDKEEELEDVIVNLLTEKGLKIATAESCTAGMLASRIVNVSGASNVFGEGFVTYSNKAKIKNLGVKKETLEKFGAVSEETVSEMATGVREKTGADIGIAITGLAGPTGGTESKPVGLVYIGISYGDKLEIRKHNLIGNREKNRTTATKQALVFLYQVIKNM